MSEKLKWIDAEIERPIDNQEIIFIDYVGMFKGTYKNLVNGQVRVENKQSDTIDWTDINQWIPYPEECETTRINQNNSTNVDYIPQKGDLFEYGKDLFWCIDTGVNNGVVNPVGESFYLFAFQWNKNKDKKPKFIRKATVLELESMGII